MVLPQIFPVVHFIQTLPSRSSGSFWDTNIGHLFWQFHFLVENYLSPNRHSPDKRAISSSNLKSEGQILLPYSHHHSIYPIGLVDWISRDEGASDLWGWAYWTETEAVPAAALPWPVKPRKLLLPRFCGSFFFFLFLSFCCFLHACCSFTLSWFCKALFFQIASLHSLFVPNNPHWHNLYDFCALQSTWQSVD